MQTKTMEVEEAQHDSGHERGMPSLDDLAEAVRKILEETQSPPKKQQESIMQEEEEQLEQFEVFNETPSPLETSRALVVYKRTLLIEYLEYLRTTWRPVTFKTLSFRHLARTKIQQSLWEEEKKKLKREIERQKHEI